MTQGPGSNYTDLHDEPADHAVGRSRGGLSSKIHSRLRARGITVVIPEPAGQAGHRKRRGSQGGRPPSFDAQDYKSRNVVERSFNVFKQWRGLATRYDKLALTCRGGAVLRAITIWLNDLSGDMP